MRTKKKILKITTFLLIALFLLLPLLSSPTIAINYCTGMSVTTTCGPTGSPITITVTNPTTTTFTDDGSSTLIVSCDVTFNDCFITNRPQSSDHDSNLWAVVKSGSGNTPSDFTGLQTLSDGDTFTDTLTLNLVAYSLPTTWYVYLNTKVWELPRGSDELEDTQSWEITLQ
jgi:hypothetical protein